MRNQAARARYAEKIKKCPDQVKAEARAEYHRNKVERNAKAKERGVAAKLKVYVHYCRKDPPVCSRCGFADVRALSLDHINSDGAKQRRESSDTGSYYRYHSIIKNGYPDDIQLLCMNCQFIKRHEKRECRNPNRVMEIPPQRTGKYAKSGSNHHRARLKDDDVIRILEIYKSGNSIKSIAKSYSMHFSSVYSIIQGNTWKHIPRSVSEPAP